MVVPDHPRACGANETLFPRNYSPYGSSPRVRGKPKRLAHKSDVSRIIPARAGQTSGSVNVILYSPDHPRACGANAWILWQGDNLYGSSPRVRGKPRIRSHRQQNHRIIPARAGQTNSTSNWTFGRADHPRACGANPAVTSDSNSRSGSSPRVRGKQSDFMRKLLSAGPSIIGFAQWLQSSCYCSCFQSSAKTPISRGTTPTSLFLGFQNSITLLLLT